MYVDVNRLKPGMVVAEDIIGKSGKPIVPKNTILTDIEIEFIKMFLIERVKIDPKQTNQVGIQQPIMNESVKEIAQKNTQKQKLTEQMELATDLEKQFLDAVRQYKRLFLNWRNNLPVNMYEVRSLCLPLFELIENESIATIVALLQQKREEQFYVKNVAMSLLSVKLAQQLKYEKSDWLQIGIASILCDAGLAKSMDTLKDGEIDYRHPAVSFDMVKNEVTLTKNSKIALLQHHERLDGSGYPMKLTSEKIHPFAQIIAVSDYYCTIAIENKHDVALELKQNQQKKLNQKVVVALLNNLDDE